jgi:hypothetical protein
MIEAFSAKSGSIDIQLFEDWYENILPLIIKKEKEAV